jgi:hypothetical protein
MYGISGSVGLFGVPESNIRAVFGRAIYRAWSVRLMNECIWVSHDYSAQLVEGAAKHDTTASLSFLTRCHPVVVNFCSKWRLSWTE